MQQHMSVYCLPSLVHQKRNTCIYFSKFKTKMEITRKTTPNSLKKCGKTNFTSSQQQQCSILKDWGQLHEQRLEVAYRYDFKSRTYFRLMKITLTYQMQQNPSAWQPTPAMRQPIHILKFHQSQLNLLYN